VAAFVWRVDLQRGNGLRSVVRTRAAAGRLESTAAERSGPVDSRVHGTCPASGRETRLASGQAVTVSNTGSISGLGLEASRTDHCRLRMVRPREGGSSDGQLVGLTPRPSRSSQADHALSMVICEPLSFWQSATGRARLALSRGLRVVTGPAGGLEHLARCWRAQLGGWGRGTR
jgi:hypothetical protein